LRPYLAILSARFRMLLQYRAAAAAGFGTQLFWGLIRMMIFEGFYRSSSAPQPLSYPQVVTYVWLGQATLALLLTGVDNDVREMIRTGTVAYELVRPLDLYGLWYSRAMAARAAPTLLRAVPMFVVAGLFLGLQPPPSPASGLAWGASTLGALLLVSAIATLTTISLLWTISGEGVSRLMPALLYVFSGMLLPLPLFPGWAQPLLNFLPFRGLVDVPFRIYLGQIPASQLLPCLLHQAAWTVALVLFGRWLLGRGMRRLVVQGG
jgi:ABC-2 type transport system permease protein